MNDELIKNHFLTLIKDNKGIILKICNSYCPNKNEREDLAQEIIYHLWKSGHTFNGDHKFSTWMYRVALNVAISFYRKGKKPGPVISMAEYLIDVEDKDAGNNEAEKNNTLLLQFINELKELDRAVMILYLENKSYDEISEILGITETNVGTKINRIKEKLKQKFLIYNKF